MRYLVKPSGSFTDRTKKEIDLEKIDVIMSTLDSETFLEICLFDLFKEIPVRKLYVCDGGSKDKTLEILRKFPRTEIFVKPEIRTTGKAIEFLISKVESEWFVLIDSDIELDDGWYDEMREHEKDFDVIENSKRTLAYHMYREDKIKIQENARALDLCHLIKKTAVKNFQCDDDYMWRFTDFFLRQVVEKSGYKYGKISTAEHTHNETERIAYKSDKEKNFQELVWKEPEWVIIDKKKADLNKIKHAKAVIKYLDPDFPMVKNDKGIDELISILDQDWVIRNGPTWVNRYNKTKSTGAVKMKIRKIMANIRKKFS